MTRTLTCITSGLVDDCGPVEYEWAYTDDDMLEPDGSLLWIPLCEVCCIYWRTKVMSRAKPYRVKSINAPR